MVHCLLAIFSYRTPLFACSISQKVETGAASDMNFTFNGNEWFMILSSLAAFCLFLRIRKHFRPGAVFILWLFEVAYVESIDFALAGTPFMVYYCADNITYEPAAAVIHLFLYPSFALLFLYSYDKWKFRGIKLAGFIAVWTCISLGFEWLNVLAGVFTYTGWKLYYSIPVYPVSAIVLIKLYHFIEFHLNRDQRRLREKEEEI